MKHLSQRVAAKQRAALQAIADASLPRVYALVYTMLDNDANITAVCDATYRTLWSTLKTDDTPDDYMSYAVHTAVCLAAEQCRRLLQKKNAKAFRMPEDRQFVLKTIPAFLPRLDQPLAVETVHLLPVLHRFILASKLAGGLTTADLAALLKLDARTATVAADAQPTNINNLLAYADEPAMTDYETLCAAWDTLVIPPSADALDAVAATINAVAAPLEKARRRKTWKIVGIIAAICVTVSALCAVVIWDMTRPDTTLTSDDTTDTTTTTASADAPADVTFTTDYTATHQATITIQDHGTITLELDATAAPQTVANFEKLANSGFYDGLTFHRIIEGFMMQGGDPLGTGGGGSDQDIVGEFAANGYANPLTHTRGAISMARATDYDSGSSQFFIVHEDSTFLDGDYAAFGYVTDGIDIVDAVCTEAVPTDGNGSIAAADQPIITSVTVTAL